MNCTYYHSRWYILKSMERIPCKGNCGGTADPRAQTGLCRSCWLGPPKFCRTCGRRLRHQNLSGLCSSCGAKGGTACKHCGVLLSVFNLTGWCSRKTECRKAYRVEFFRTIQAYKLERGCADCGFNKHPAALEFDHLHSKIATISNMAGWPLDKLAAEINKCEVVCSNCHHIRTYERKRNQSLPESLLEDSLPLSLISLPVYPAITRRALSTDMPPRI